MGESKVLVGSPREIAQAFNSEGGRPSHATWDLNRRQDYLSCQRLLEGLATEMMYWTPRPTHCVATEAFIQRICGRELETYRPLVTEPFETWRQGVLGEMLERRTNLSVRIQAGAVVKVLCDPRRLTDDAATHDPVILANYRALVQRLHKGDDTLRLRYASTAEHGPTSCAVMSWTRGGDQRFAKAFAQQTGMDVRHGVHHVIECATDDAHSARHGFEAAWDRALDEQVTLEKLKQLFL